ncbi:hypothetical protein B0J13DRAFT_636608 [Dactylonectria estremocensis]|uniref:Uncharacterized protein n=1 Tax=Dactylonectria estremocensis TaxID=1079267 RepID=A0A9P9ESX1_9HYPO|nr:hypothetical protein B0J13DRAFT_636608 [Dactylonectria estremocensis]
MSNQHEEVDEVASDSSDYGEIDTVEKWHEVVSAIEPTTRERFSAGPSADDTSVSDFQHHWRDVFPQLSLSISNDPTVSHFLTSPPTKKVSIFLFDVTKMGCLCCLPETNLSITLQNEDGVTKDDVLKGFIDYMYGESLPLINNQDGSEVSEGTRALVYGSSWMSQRKNEDGVKVALVPMVAPADRIPDIWFYCSDPRGYPDKVEKQRKSRIGETWWSVFPAEDTGRANGRSDSTLNGSVNSN